MNAERSHAALPNRASGTRRGGGYFLLWMTLWTLVVGGLLVKDIRHIREQTLEVASAEARVHLNKDMAARLWATSHGGVYVPATQATSPNPHLHHVPERDILTLGGRTLTLMNPAYMLRQMMEHYTALYGARGHITGLKHFGDETAPDEWEKNALARFSRGVEEVCEVCEIGGEPYMRLMKPLFTEQECLKCHGFQGYQVGEVRGGVSISVPLAQPLERGRKHTLFHAFSFALLWAMGSGAIGLTAYGLMRRTRERDRAEELLRRSQKNHSGLVENSLTGIYVNLDGKIAFANPRLAEMFGYTLEELKGMDYLELVHPEDRERVAEYRERRLQGLEAPNVYEVRGLTKAGETLWIRKRNTRTDYEGRLAILSNVEDVTEHRRNARRLEESETMLRNLSARLLLAHEEERKKVAYEIHEGLAQSLSAAKFRMESILADLKGKETLKVIHTLSPVVDIIQESIATVRQIAHRLRPMMLDDLGILPAVAWLCRLVASEHPDLSVKFQPEVEEREIPEPLKVVIYRVLERALHGIARKNDADLVEISLRREGDRLVLTVRENGTGLRAEAGTQEEEVPVDVNLGTIRERCMLSDAALSICSPEEGWTILAVSWPS